MSLNETLDQIEEDIRLGRVISARNLRASLNFNKVEDAMRLRIANLFRRALDPRSSLIVLDPLVNENPDHREASSKEIAEYCVALYRVGSATEAAKRLGQIDAKEVPEKLLFESFCLFSMWNYQDSIAKLKAYVRLEPDPYKKCVGRVNLAAALVETEDEEFVGVIEEIKESTLKQQWWKLYKNALELECQWHLKQGDFRKSKECLNESSRLVSIIEGSFEVHFFQKWQSILQAFEASSIEPIEKFRVEMKLKSHWETYRDLDFHTLLIKPADSVFQRLYAGTAYSSYKQKLLRKFSFEPDKTYKLNPSRRNVVSIEQMEFNGDNLAKRGKSLHNLARILYRDLYRPISLGGIFSELFPDEHFSIFTSADRVHQLVKRLRRVYSQTKQLEIQEIQGCYRMRPQEQLQVVVSADVKLTTIFEEQLKVVDSVIGSSERESITRKSVANILEISSASAGRWIQESLSLGHLEQVKFGSKSKYRRTA